MSSLINFLLVTCYMTEIKPQQIGPKAVSNPNQVPNCNKLPDQRSSKYNLYLSKFSILCFVQDDCFGAKLGGPGPVSQTGW